MAGTRPFVEMHGLRRLAVATPATIRYRILHVAGRITTSSRQTTLHLDASWPWAHTLAAVFRRIRALPTPT